MDRAKKMFVAGLSLASMAVAAVPAQAQYYPPPPPPGGGIAGEIARGAGRAAEAVGAIENAVRGAIYGYHGYQGSRERYAIQACGYRAERYGQVRIDYVEPYKRRSWRITGTADPRGRFDDRRYGYNSSRYTPRSFTCVVREDGRVTKFSTRRVRY